MTGFDYTKEYSVSSSLIEGVYANENDDTVVLDVSDTMYRYSGVTLADVSVLVRGGETGSVGNYYNTVFKTKFGPAENLGHWGDLDYNFVSVIKENTTPTTPKGLTYENAYANSAGSPHLVVASDNSGETKQFSLNSEPVFDHSVSGSPVAVIDEPTKEFSLSSPALSVVNNGDENISIRVHFTLDEHGDKKFKYDAKSDDVHAAVDELRDYVGAFGATGKISKVVVKFD